MVCGRVGKDLPDEAIVCCVGNCSNGTIFGTDIYRGDSTACTAARHAGVLTAEGGFYIVSLLGPYDSFRCMYIHSDELIRKGSSH